MIFADEVRQGLTDRPKHLSSKYFYDALGSALFEAITQLPEYYLTRAEDAILRDHAAEIVDAAGPPIELVELGSGSATKTRYLIEAALARQPDLCYRPIDISRSAIESSHRALSAEYPNIAFDGVVADYFEGLKRIAATGNGRRRLTLFLGSNIGNFEPDEAERVLREVRGRLNVQDALLLGADLRKDRRVLEAAYDDALGVTAAFNKNVLGRINRELGGHFDLRTFRHTARYNDKIGRMEMHVVSLVDQTVRIDALDLDVRFRADEGIFTESSYKYAPQQIEALATATGFEVARSWTDDECRFSSNLLVAR